MDKWEARRSTASPTSAGSVNALQVEIREARDECGHTWTQAKRAGVWVPKHCPACERVKVDARPVSRETSRTDVLEAMHNAGVNVPKYRNATLVSFDGSEDPHALERAREYVEAWAACSGERWAPRDWMFLYGAGSDRKGRELTIGRLGNGKTHIAVAIARALIERQLLDPRRFAFRTAEAILIESEATFRSNSEDSEAALLRRYGSLQLLIIDDLGVRDSYSSHVIRLFDELTKRREAHGTIWTSNLSIPVIQRAAPGLERVTSRIAGECGDGGRYVVRFEGRNRRNERTMRVA